MTDDLEHLAQIQRWMRTVITHPDGITGGLNSPEAQAELSISAKDVEQVIGRSQALSSIERLQVYGNAYYARLIECLAAEFPALRHAVGEEVFSGFVFGYLQQHPPESYTLSALGRGFPLYLRESRPSRNAEAPDWADFLVDLSTLERSYAEVFDGPGEEHEPRFDASALASIPEVQTAGVRLLTARSLRLLEVRFPVHEYEMAVRRQRQTEVPAAAATWLAIHRREYVVHRRPLSRVQFSLLGRLQQGANLGEAVAAMEAEALDLSDACAEQLQSWFRDWTSAGYFRGMSVESP